MDKVVNVSILLDISEHKKGTSVEVAVDEHGTPLERFWRRRFDDAKTDHCLEIIQSSSKKEATEKPNRNASGKKEK